MFLYSIAFRLTMLYLSSVLPVNSTNWKSLFSAASTDLGGKQANAELAGETEGEWTAVPLIDEDLVDGLEAVGDASGAGVADEHAGSDEEKSDKLN